MAHLTLFVKEPDGTLDSILGAFYCEEARRVVHEDDKHECARTTKEVEHRGG